MQDFFTELDSDILTPKPLSPVAPAHPDNRARTPHPRKEHTHAPRPPKRHPQNRGAEKKTTDTASNHVTEMRSQMMKAGAVVIVFKVDEKSRTLLGHLRLETRGFAFVEEVRELHKVVIKKARASYEDTVKDIPDIEEKDLLKIIRRDMEIFLQNRIERIPVIIPIIVEI